MVNNNNKKLPWFEDIVFIYLKQSLDIMFPKKCKNKAFVYFLSFLHIFGATILSYGVWFLPPKYLGFYIFYSLINIYVNIIFFRKRCFMTLLSNYYAEVKGSPLPIRSNLHIFNISIGLLLAIFGYTFPRYAPLNMLKKLYCEIL